MDTRFTYWTSVAVDMALRKRGSILVVSYRHFIQPGMTRAYSVLRFKTASKMGRMTNRIKLNFKGAGNRSKGRLDIEVGVMR